MFSVFLHKGERTRRWREQTDGEFLFAPVYSCACMYLQSTACIKISHNDKNGDVGLPGNKFKQPLMFLPLPILFCYLFWCISRPNPDCREKAAVPLYTTHWWGTASSSSWSTPWTPSAMKVESPSSETRNYVKILRNKQKQCPKKWIIIINNNYISCAKSECVFHVTAKQLCWRLFWRLVLD